MIKHANTKQNTQQKTTKQKIFVFLCEDGILLLVSSSKKEEKNSEKRKSPDFTQNQNIEESFIALLSDENFISSLFIPLSLLLEENVILQQNNPEVSNLSAENVSLNSILEKLPYQIFIVPAMQEKLETIKNSLPPYLSPPFYKQIDIPSEKNPSKDKKLLLKESMKKVLEKIYIQ